MNVLLERLTLLTDQSPHRQCGGPAVGAMPLVIQSSFIDKFLADNFMKATTATMHILYTAAFL